MYAYDQHDQAFVRARAKEFRDQVHRRLNGQLSEDEFKPLRLRNGLYLQLHAYMLRIAIPYGVLSSDQMRTLAHLAEHYDRGYGHFTTRQNIQFNWTKLADVPDMLDILADAGMHAIQTSGNCIRNVTTDAFAGVAGDEEVDPRPTAELLRQWSSLHPEFAHLPRKFKIAVVGAADDRAAMKFHDIGLRAYAGVAGERPSYDIWVGGGQGRTPRVARLFEERVLFHRLLPTLDSMLRIYNLHGRRDNKYKARIKILIDELGIEPYRDEVAADMAANDPAPFTVAGAEYDRIAAQFADPVASVSASIVAGEGVFGEWLANNVSTHRVEGHAVVSVSLKGRGEVPGDVTAEQMRGLADLADEHSRGELRITHRQNVVLPWVRASELTTLHERLVDLGLATGNIGLTSDIIACPGLDYCALATARSIPIAQELSEMLRTREAHGGGKGAPTLNISGCINACGHHHAANIGILGLNRAETESYQITLGGRADSEARVGDILGPGFGVEEITGAIGRVMEAWDALREGEESFVATYDRVGKAPFKDAVYGANEGSDRHVAA